MNISKKFFIGFISTLLAAVLSLTKGYAQFEVAPSLAGGIFTGKSIGKIGITFDVGVSARYTFQSSASVSLQARIDILYSNARTQSITRNLFQDNWLQNRPGFNFEWQDHLIRIPLTLGLRFNEIFNGDLALRMGGYYGRGLSGKARCIECPGISSTPFEFNSYSTDGIEVVNDGNSKTLIHPIAQNASRVGIILAVDYKVWQQMEVSLSYVKDLNSAWSYMGTDTFVYPNVNLQTIKIGASYWF